MSPDLTILERCATFIESSDSKTILVLILLLVVLLNLVSDPGRRRHKFVKEIDRFPGPVAIPLLGNASQLLFPPSEIFTWMENVFHKWGDVARFWVFRNPKIFVNSHDIAMQLLSRKNFLLKSEEFLPLSPIGEWSLVGVPPEVHTTRRKLLIPGFSRQKVDDSIWIFEKHAASMKESLLREKCDTSSGSFDVMHYTALCSYKIGCEIGFGAEIMDSLQESDYRLQIKAWQRLLENLVERSLQPWFKYDFLYNLTPKGRQVLKCFDQIGTFGKSAITMRRAQRQNLKPESGDKKCFLDLLLELREKGDFTETDVFHELNIFIVAGYDTTGTTAAWALFFLSSHPEIQEKCFLELQHIFAPRSSPLEITPADIRAMKYLDLCIKETLRLYPVLPWLLRRTDEDIQLSDGRIIPSGVDVLINTYIIHRDPANFQNPTEFRPERHLDPKLRTLPFGAGPRSCPGMQFATVELKVILAELLLAFRWESVDRRADVKPLFHGVLVPNIGVNVKITRRM